MADLFQSSAGEREKPRIVVDLDAFNGSFALPFDSRAGEIHRFCVADAMNSSAADRRFRVSSELVDLLLGEGSHFTVDDTPIKVYSGETKSV